MKKTDIKSLFRSTMFWDANEIDPELNAGYVISRVLDYGDIEDIQVLKRVYSNDRIRDVVRKRRGLFPKTGKYWAVKFNIPFQEVACLRKYYQEGL